MRRWQRWAEAALRRPVTFEPLDNPGGEARVWRLRAQGRAIAYLKQHRVPDKWRRERRLLEWLSADPAAPVPELLAADPEGQTLLLGALPGAPADSVPLSIDQRRSLHEQAGRFRRRLDAVAVDAPDPTPLPAAIARRHRAWCERARPHLPAALLARAQQALRPDCFEGARRRWCHRDLAPYNWIVDPSATPPRLGIIDFGQARPDVWLVDVLKLWDRDWQAHPSLADAFWTGYGRAPDAAEQRQLRQLALLHGLATTTWAARHGDEALRAHGRAVLDRALELAS